MRKSLPKTPPSELSSRLAHLPPAGLLAGAARLAPRPDGGPNGRRSALTPVGRSSRHPELEARLRLLEGFLSRTDIDDCGQHALQWLAETLGVAQSICLVRTAADQALFTAASVGFPAATSFTVS